jgi:hypothetical protein
LESQQIRSLGNALAGSNFPAIYGAILACCGKNAAALHLLKDAVEANYCAYSNLL